VNKILIALVLAVVMSGNVHAKDKKLCRDLEIEISEQLEIFQMYLEYDSYGNKEKSLSAIEILGQTYKQLCQ